MKKLLLIVLTLITFNSYSNELLDKAKEISTEIVDSAKQAVKETTTFVDTSSNFKMLYSDLKTGLSALAESLKVGAEHVYIILVKQQVVNSITWLIVGVIPLLIFIIFSKSMFNWAYKNNGESEGFSWFVFVIFLLATIIPGILTLINAQEIVMGFINPEYGAIMDIINFVKK